MGEDVAVEDTPVPGSLVIADRVGIAVAERAALGVDGVVSATTGVGSLLGEGVARGLASGTLPRAAVDMSLGAPRVAVKVALAWPSAIADVCRAVRRRVIDDLVELTGVHPAAVDVDVVRLVPASSARAGRGMVELPAPEATDPEPTAPEPPAPEPTAPEPGDPELGAPEPSDAEVAR